MIEGRFSLYTGRFSPFLAFIFRSSFEGGHKKIKNLTIYILLKDRLNVIILYIIKIKVI